MLHNLRVTSCRLFGSFHLPRIIARKTPSGEWDIYQGENIGYSFHTIREGIVESPGVVFFATDGGILRFVNSAFSIITSQNSNIPSNNLRSMGLDAEGNMWGGSGTDGIQSTVQKVR
jgi:ligand-binding sensor domain-containing protein